MIPFNNRDGLRDYRVPATPHRRRWPWLALIAFLAALLCGVRR